MENYDNNRTTSMIVGKGGYAVNYGHIIVELTPHHRMLFVARSLYYSLMNKRKMNKSSNIIRFVC